MFLYEIYDAETGDLQTELKKLSQKGALGEFPDLPSISCFSAFILSPPRHTDTILPIISMYPGLVTSFPPPRVFPSRRPKRGRPPRRHPVRAE